MSAICGLLGDRPGTHPDSDVGAMLDALADYGPGRAGWSDGPVSGEATEFTHSRRPAVQLLDFRIDRR